MQFYKVKFLLIAGAEKKFFIFSPFLYSPYYYPQIQKSNELGGEFSPKFDISKRSFSQLRIFPAKTAHPFFDFGCAVYKKLIFDSYVFLSFLYVFYLFKNVSPGILLFFRRVNVSLPPLPYSSPPQCDGYHPPHHAFSQDNHHGISG